MSVLEASMLLVAAINFVLLVAVVILLVRLTSLLSLTQRVIREQGVPFLDKLNRVADDLSRVSVDFRRVGERVSGTATRVMNEVEPPIRQLAALLAGLRAGVGKMFEHGGHRDGDAAEAGERRKE